MGASWNKAAGKYHTNSTDLSKKCIHKYFTI
jgi:hypothetical protein